MGRGCVCVDIDSAIYALGRDGAGYTHSAQPPPLLLRRLSAIKEEGTTAHGPWVGTGTGMRGTCGLGG